MGFLSSLFRQQSTPEALSANYASEKHGVSFRYPGHWAIHTEDQLEEMHTYVVKVGQQRTDRPSLGLTVIVMAPTQKDDDIEGYLKNSQTQFAAVFPGFKAHKYKRTTFQAHNAAWMEHSYDGNSGRVREATMTVFVDQPHFSLPLQLVFETASDDFRQDLATFEAILESVKIDVDELKGNLEIQYV